MREVSSGLVHVLLRLASPHLEVRSSKPKQAGISISVQFKNFYKHMEFVGYHNVCDDADAVMADRNVPIRIPVQSLLAARLVDALGCPTLPHQCCDRKNVIFTWLKPIWA